MRIVAIALGELQGCIEKNIAHLVITETLRDVVVDFDWAPPRPYVLLNDIYRLLSLLLLQHHERLIEVDLSEVEEAPSHPIPKGSENEGLVEFWAREVGKILVLHDKRSDARSFFIGVACEHAFAGEQLNAYADTGDGRMFPLIGPANISKLDDAYEWDIPSDVFQKQVKFRDALKNCGALGAIDVEPPSGGSHYKARFKGARSWILDPNADPLPERFLKELVPITGYPLAAVKYTLICGELPKRHLRLAPKKKGRDI